MSRANPFPVILTNTYADDATQPFWDAARAGRLAAPRCTNCGTFRLPPAPFCFACQHQDVEWVDLPGTATLYSFTIVHHPLGPDLADHVPYVSAIVELDGTQGAGARMIVNLIDVDLDTVTIGDRLRAVFEPAGEEMTVIRFRPA